MNYAKCICLGLASCIFYACSISPEQKKEMAEAMITLMSDSIVPDKRTAVFDVEPVVTDSQLILKGVTTSKEAKEATLNLFAQFKWQVADSIRLLPDSASVGSIYGIVNHSVVPMNSKPRFSSEMSTQALLGMPVRILQKDSWLRVQMADNYIAWTVAGYIKQVSREVYNAWMTAPKVIFLSHYGTAYSKPDLRSTPVSDLVSGCMLKLEGVEGSFYKVSYPDGRTGYVRTTEAKPVDEWLKGINLSAESLINAAYSLNGTPYLWGGTSSKGVDCSGFIKTITFLHGLILQRDASQQVHTGIPVDISAGYDNLQPGDLLFFGEKATADNKERIIHVGLYVGDKTFIHSINNVHTGSFDPESDLYDDYNTKRFLRASRILGAVGTQGISTIQSNPFYQPQ